ncbi:MAG: L-rhamnonate dehydratase [Bryobacterales bacterium]|nr:L-rhamnonate dehydratase [Bryobacterales bacterium]
MTPTRRTFLRSALAGAAGGLSFAAADPDLKITGVRLVKTRPKNPLPSYAPAPDSYWVNREAARPISIYPQFTGRRGPGSKWMPDPAGPISSFTVEIATNKGVKGYGRGGDGGGPVVEGHLAKLITGENPLDIERLWDIQWRATLFYGRAGAAVHAISAIDLALWDLAGKVRGEPVYKLLGGRTWERLPAYATGNDIEQSVKFGFKKVKLALVHGPAQGREGLKKNVEQVKRTRELLGPDGDIMIDCWMALTETYTLQLADAIAPYRVHWLEEVLQPDDYEGFGRLREKIRSTLLATGEHEYTRWGFGRLLHYKAVDIWQPDIKWCGGMSEMRHIGSMALANGIPLIPHIGGSEEPIHYLAYMPALTWAETTLPPPGGPDRVYKMFEEQRLVSRGPEGVYLQPSERPGFGLDIDVA